VVIRHQDILSARFALTFAFTCRAAWRGVAPRKTGMAARSGARLC